MLVAVLVFVLVSVLYLVRWDGHYQAAMLYTLEADQHVGKLGNLGRLAVHDQYFKAGIVVQVRMAGGDHQFMVRVLRLGQLFRDAVRVVVEDERDRAHDYRFRRRGLLGYQSVAN